MSFAFPLNMSRWMWMVGGIGILATLVTIRISTREHMRKQMLQQIGQVREAILVPAWGRMQLRYMRLDTRWIDVGADGVWPHASCQEASAVTSKARRVLGYIRTEKIGGAWNTFSEPVFFSKVRLVFVCVGKALLPVPLELHASVPWQWMVSGVTHIRETVVGAIGRMTVPEWVSGFLIALVSGDERAMPRAAKEVLCRTYIWHMCVVSGVHVVWIFGAWAWIWRLATLGIRMRSGVHSVYADSIGIGLMTLMFVLWFGLMPSAMRGLGFYVCFWLFPSGSHIGWHIGMRCVVGMVLLACFPHFCGHIGFWMSAYASLGYWLTMHSLRHMTGIWQWVLGMEVMNIWMMPWMWYLTGEVLWPVMLLSPLVCIAVVGLVVVGMLGLGQWDGFVHLPECVLWMLGQMPSWCSWVWPLSEMQLVGICISGLCVWCGWYVVRGIKSVPLKQLFCFVYPCLGFSFGQ